MTQVLASRWCFDCEIDIPGDAALCSSCERHRADGHGARTLYEGQCHGAGPDGLTTSRQAIDKPRGLMEEELTPWLTG